MLCLEKLSLKFFSFLISVDMCKVFNDHRWFQGFLIYSANENHYGKPEYQNLNSDS